MEVVIISVLIVLAHLNAAVSLDTFYLMMASLVLVWIIIMCFILVIDTVVDTELYAITKYFFILLSLNIACS